MKSFLERMGNRARQWEVFTSTFFNYIFLTEEGRPIRKRFIQSVLTRTVLYCLFAVPVYALFFYLGWIRWDAFGQNVGFAAITLLAAFGFGVLGAIRAYRGRVRLFYLSQQTNEQVHDDEVPTGHQEIPAARKKKKVKIRELTAKLPPERDPAVDQPAKGRGGGGRRQPLGQEDLALVHCTQCGRDMMLRTEAARKLTRCQYCGGEVAH